MDNSEIRAKILRLHYDLEMNNPGRFFEVDKLPTLITGVPQNLLDANILYLCESGLINGMIPSIGRVTPVATRITPLGTNVVERPGQYSERFTMSVQVLNVGTNYGQVAQADRRATVEQTQTYSSFNELRELVRKHTELNDTDRQRIEKVLAHLEETTAQKGLTQKIIEEAKQALAEYGWLIPPLITVLAKALGLG